MIGNPHRDYKKHRAVVDKVYDEFEKSITKPNMVTLSDKTGVPETTLRAWYRRWKQDEDWRPYAPRSRAQQHTHTVLAYAARYALRYGCAARQVVCS